MLFIGIVEVVGRCGGVRTPTSSNEGRGVDGPVTWLLAWWSTKVMADPGVTWWSPMLAVAAVSSEGGRLSREALLEEEMKTKSSDPRTLLMVM